MYQDNRPCEVCGAEVRLRSKSRDSELTVHEPDDTVDRRVCTNSDCETNQSQRGPDAPTP